MKGSWNSSKKGHHTHLFRAKGGCLLSLLHSGDPLQYLVQQICAKICKNRAIDDTSMKFGAQLDNTFRKIFGCRDIADSSCDKNGSHFQMWSL